MSGLEEAGPPLEATGERLIPELQHGEVVHAEHLARYRLAADLVRSRRVLDIACGEGYGTDMLAAGGARSAIGVDIDARTVGHARSRYPSCEFLTADIQQLPFDDGVFDLVVSFETIEHVSNPERALEEMARVLSDTGLLLISTPNKHQYLVENEFHDREFLHEEFLELLSTHFTHVEPLLQHNWLASAVFPPAEASECSGRNAEGTRFGKLTGVEQGAELYTLALCGGGAIPVLRPVVVAAGLDEAHDLARRLVNAERSAEDWHREFISAKRTAEAWHREYMKALAVYDTVWWRMTRPLRWIADRVRGRDG